MSEQKEDFAETLSKLSSLDDLRAALPPKMTEKLGEGDTGADKAIALLTGLSVFAPSPATFDKNAFNAVVAVDDETGEPLPQDEATKLLNVALEAGILKTENAGKERYSIDSRISSAVQRILGEEE